MSHLRHTRGDRGFVEMPALAGRLAGESVTLRESPLATEPAIWVEVVELLDAANPRAGSAVVRVELSTAAALQLAEQLYWLVWHHRMAPIR